MPFPAPVDLMTGACWPQQSPPLPATSPTAPVLPVTDAPLSARQMSQLRRRLREAMLAAPQSATDDAEDAADAITDAVERLELVVEELTSNGRRHGRAPVRVAVHAADGGWLVSVTDAAPDRPPAPAIDRDPAAGGMGLHMVAHTAVACGWTPTDEDKTVWAVVAAG
jgi:anti-sigma regulatory factor (Ser/Thr protein kinase)